MDPCTSEAIDFDWLRSRISDVIAHQNAVGWPDYTSADLVIGLLLLQLHDRTRAIEERVAAVEAKHIGTR